MYVVYGLIKWIALSVVLFAGRFGWVSFTSGPVTPEFVYAALLGLLHSGWDGPCLAADETQ